jgi:hypothetical protein
MGKSFEKMFASTTNDENGFEKNENTTLKQDIQPHKVVAKKSGRRRDEPTEGDIRRTYLVNKDLSEKIESISYWERSSIKDIVNEAFNMLITKYEKSKGEVEPKPPSKHKSIFK